MTLGTAARPVGLRRPSGTAGPGSARPSTTTCASTRLADPRPGHGAEPPWRSRGQWDDTIVVFHLRPRRHVRLHTGSVTPRAGASTTRSCGCRCSWRSTRVTTQHSVTGALGSPRQVLAAHHCRAGRKGAADRRRTPPSKAPTCCPVFAETVSASVLDHLLFAQDSAQTREPGQDALRVSGFFDRPGRSAPAAI